MRSKSATKRGVSDCPRNACWDFWEGKKCRTEESGKKCPFKHVKGSVPQAAPQKCSKCGGDHQREVCSFTGACAHCGRTGTRRQCVATSPASRRSPPRTRSKCIWRWARTARTGASAEASFKANRKRSGAEIALLNEQFEQFEHLNNYFFYLLERKGNVSTFYL